MQLDLWQRRLGWLALVAVVLCSGGLAQRKLLADDDQNEPKAPRIVEKLLQSRNDELNRPVRDGDFRKLYSLTKDVFGGEGGKYWIGVECREASPELRAQLGLDDGQGLIVVHVAEDSPAAKAGLKQHDVVVAAADTKLAGPRDLVKAVDGAEGKEVTLKIIRAGKEKSLQVTPGERPKDQIQFLARPGMGMVFAGGPPPALPDNVTVSISRHGKEPAKISVSRGDEKWDINDQELNKLPDDLRPYVERMLGGGPMTISMQNTPSAALNRWLAPQIRIEGQVQPHFQPQAPGPPGQPGVAPPQGSAPYAPQPAQQRGPAFLPHAQADMPDDVGRRLEDIDRQLQRLQDELRRMRENGPNPPRDHDQRGPAPQRQGRVE